MRDRVGLLLVSPVLVVAVAAGGPPGCAGTAPCERNSDCMVGYCRRGECVRDCIDSALDCPAGEFCNDLSQCEPIGGSAGGGANGGTAGDAGGGGSGGGTGAAGAGGTGGVGGTGGAKQALEPCSEDGECDSSLVCRSLVKGGSKRCTPSCTSESPCPNGTQCLDDGAGSSCLGNDAGRSCTEAATCNFACLLGPDYCTTPCVVGADCPNGYGCMPVGSPAQRVCIKAEAYCNAGDTSACVVSSACDESPDLILGGCTLACDSASDCPQRALPMSPWTCDGLCRRPPDVYGPLPGGYTPAEYHCNESLQPVNLCNDAQHIDFVQFTIPPAPPVDCDSQYTTSGQAGDACLDSCRYGGGCSYGYACVALGSISGQRIGLCLPTGNLEPGSPCANDTQCAFGYCASGTCSRDCTADGLCPGGLTCVAGGDPPVEGMSFRRCE